MSKKTKTKPAKKPAKLIKPKPGKTKKISIKTKPKILKKSVTKPKPKPAKKTAPVKKAAAKKPAPKKAATKKIAPKKPVAKKTAPKKAVAKKPAKQAAVKKTATKKIAPKKPVTKTAPVKSTKKTIKPTPETSGKKTGTPTQPPIRINIEREKARPAAFSMDEIREIAKAAAKVEAASKAAAAKTASARVEKIIAEKLAKAAAKPTRVKAASLADILGFNPAKKEQRLDPDAKDIPDRFRKYYKLLIQLRTSLTHQIDEHSEETLKHSNKEDAGDLSSYGQHDADAGTDAFDRDFALSMVASEQEALTEIDAAIQRIKAGTYGICEITHQPISKDRLLAVPFTRYCTEAQKEIERYRLRSRTQAGLTESAESDTTIGTAGGDDSGD